MRATSSGNGNRVNLADVQTVENNFYYWADQAVSLVPAALVPGAAAQVTLRTLAAHAAHPQAQPVPGGQTGSLRLQNVSGFTVSRDFQQIVRASAMEGALCVYRYFNLAAGAADLEFHGRISVGEVSPIEASLTLSDIYDFAGNDAPGHDLL